MSAPRWLAALVLLFGCEGGSGAPAVKREPLTLMLGEPGDSLGTRLATCADGTVVAAAPGRPGLWVVDAGVRPLPRDAGPWTEVACVTSSGGQHWFAAAGHTGVARAVGSSGWQQLATGEFLSLAGGPRGAPLLAGGKNTRVSWFDADMAALLPIFMFGESEVDSLAWYPDGQGVLVGSSSVSGVDDYGMDAGVPVIGPTLFYGNHFGRAVVVGDVSPRPGLERVVSTDGEVWIIDSAGITISVLRGSQLDFGAALALGPSGYPGLQALWVSEPSSGHVSFFIGDAGVDATPPNASTTGALGSSLAFARGSLYVGAPQTAPGGAIVIVPVSIPEATNFALRECGPTSCVQAGCAGVCVGGVVCDFDACVRVDAGAFDGGGFDGGGFDGGGFDGGGFDGGGFDGGGFDGGGFDGGGFDGGGFGFDGGGFDGGGFDGGGFDGGGFDGGGFDAGSAPVDFSTRGCTSVDGAPLIFLLAVLLRVHRL